MARVVGPLLSITASKTFGKAIEFSRRWGKNFVRLYQKPTGSPSSNQVVIRGYFEEATQMWQTLTQNEKDQWHTFNGSA
jgi:hypothetical protein